MRAVIIRSICMTISQWELGIKGAPRVKVVCDIRHAGKTRAPFVVKNRNNSCESRKWQSYLKVKTQKISRQDRHKGPAPWEPKHRSLEIFGRDYRQSKWRFKDELTSTSPVIRLCLPQFATKRSSALTHWMEEKDEWGQSKIDVGRQEGEGVSPERFWLWVILNNGTG